MALPHALLVSNGLSFSAQYSRNASRKRDSVQVDAHRQERVDVQAAHFNVLNAAGHQRLDRSFAGVGHALGRMLE